MSKKNILNKKTIFTGLIFALFSLLLMDYLWAGILLILIYLLGTLYKEKLIIPFSIVALLVLVSDINSTIRTVVNLFCSVLLLFLFIQKYGTDYKYYPKIPKELILFLKIFYIAMLLSTIFSEYYQVGMQQLIRVTLFFFIVYLLYSLIETRTHVYLILSALLISGSILIGSIIYGFASSNISLAGLVAVSQTRTVGILSNVNAPGGIAVSILPILISFLFYKEFSQKKILYFFAIVILAGILLTTSRSAFLAIAASVTFLLLYFYGTRLVKLIPVFLLSSLLLYLIPGVSEAVNLLFRIESGLSQRNYLWGISISMIRDNPVFGIGPGAYSYEMLKYFPVMFESFVGKELLVLREITIGANNSHNFFLYYFSDMGIFGLISSLLLPFTFFRIGYKTLKLNGPIKDDTFYITIGIIAAGIGLFVRGIFEGIGILTYGWIKMDLPFWLLFSVLIFIYYKSRETYTKKNINHYEIITPS